MGRLSVLLLPYWVWFSIMIVGPIFVLIVVSLATKTALGPPILGVTAEAYFRLLQPNYLDIVFRSLVLAFWNTLICLSLAFPFAFLVSRLTLNRQVFVMTFILIPFWTNFLIRILAFMDVLRWQPLGLQLTYTSTGVLAAMVYNYLPLAILVLLPAMQKIEEAVLEAAQDLGASNRQIFTQVLWPLTKPSVFAAAVVIFIPSLGEFLIPDIVGGGKVFYLGGFLYHQFLVARDWPLGAAVVCLLIGLTLACLVILKKRLNDEDTALV